MLIRCGFEISFAAGRETPMLAQLSVHTTRQADLRTPQHFVTSPQVPIHDYIDIFGNICSRFTAPEGGLTLSTDFIIEDSGLPDVYAPDAPQLPVEALPDEVLIYLLGSRYCETDRLSDIAWGLFGPVDAGWKRVQAIVDFTHDHIEFGYEYARSTKTAWDSHQERRGVCRDYAHLAITLCRCMNIPARYCTGYLGDIGVPPMDCPMDFSAWFEAYLGGQWYIFDARHNMPRIGRILMARGLDAADTALTTSFGPTPLNNFVVRTEEVAAVEALECSPH